MVDHVIVQTVFVPQISGSIDCFYLLDENKWVINEEQATQFTKKGAQKLLELLGIDSDNIINFTVRPKTEVKRADISPPAFFDSGVIELNRSRK